MPEHLQLPEPRPLASRRSGSGPPGDRPPRDPASHGGKLRGDLASIAAARLSAARVVIEGVDPRLVFKVRATTRLDLNPRGLTFLGDTVDWTYFVVPHDVEASQLLADLAEYESGDGPRVLEGFFGNIEGIEPYSAEDRRGPGLPDGPFDGTHVTDVHVWPSKDREEARSRLADIRRVVDRFDGRVMAVDDRESSTAIRAAVGRDALDAILDLMVVEQARSPVAPFLEPSDWIAARQPDVSVPPPLDVVVGIADGGVFLGHPLLAGVVSDVTPGGQGAGPFGSHGSMVAGLAAYGDFEPALRADEPLPAPARVAVVRVLEPEPGDERRTRFEGLEPEHVVVERAVRVLHEHGCRVVNLSVTDPDAYSGPHVSAWTETLDRLARELDIVIVTAAGNRPMPASGEMAEGTHVRHHYPTYVLDEEARIAEPAVAANVLTVGSIARSGAAARADGRSHPEDIAVAASDELSPFSRTGPGVNGTHRSGALKPEFVHYGGNLVWNGLNRITDLDPGASVVSTSLAPDGRLFAVGSGTSFAAPRVARAAAAVLASRPDASANLVRALLGVSAAMPEAAARQFGDEVDGYRAFGYGVPDGRRATESDPTRVVMIHEGEVACNGAVIHPIPIPEAFATGRADRLITVAMACDPPVRRQRREYTAGHLGLDFYRALSVDEVEEIVRKQVDGDEAVPLPTNRVRVVSKLRPGAQTCEASTLQVRSWKAADGRSLSPDDGDTYYLVVKHFMESWAAQLADEYTSQRYALVIQVEDRTRIGIDLHAQLQARLRAEAEARIRLGT